MLMEKYIHKINGITGKTSLSVVIPHNISEDLNILKGDYVEIKKKGDNIILRKLVMQTDLINTGILNEAICS